MISRRYFIFPVLGLLLLCGTASHAWNASPEFPANSLAGVEEQALRALFERSDLTAAERLARQALTMSDSAAAEFVLMEAGALRGDEAQTLDAALALCRSDSGPYARIAAARIRAMASASRAFRARLPQLRQAAESRPELPALPLALVAAAADRAPEITELLASRDSGLLTDWRIVGPFGTQPYLDFDRHWAPERDGLKRSAYGQRKAENFQFADGQLKLPPYFAADGVYYAESQLNLRSQGEWRIFLESGGTVEVYIDGRKVLARDDRRAPQPLNLRKDISLATGGHRVLVKFLRGAAPFRLAVMPPTGGVRPHPNIPSIHASESGFVSAALHYWEGDLAGAVESLESLTKRAPSASAHFLLAQAWAAIDETAPEQLSEYEAALKLAPEGAAAEVAAGRLELRADRVDAVLPRLARLLPPNSDGRRLQGSTAPAALELFIDVAGRLGWESDQEAAWRLLLEQTESCSAIRRAADFFLSGETRVAGPEHSNEPEFAGALAARLERCDPLAMARLRARAGDHAQAAAMAAKAIARNLTGRAAREFYVRELMLTEARDEAVVAARELQTVAPNSVLYRQLAAQAAAGATVFSRKAPSASFYRPYRRDGLEIARRTAGQRFAGDSVVLLNDRVLSITPDGARSLYVHLLTRVLNRQGIERAGEVALPEGARLLELRTLKADGGVLEPELTRYKQTITMPALAAGDVIEQEFALDQPEAETSDWPDEWSDFDFSSAEAPVLASRFVLIAPPEIRVLESGVVPKAGVRENGDGRTVRVWEQNQLMWPRLLESDLPKSPREPSLHVTATAESLPEYAAGCGEAMLEAARPGVRTALLARRLTGGVSGEESKARALADWVQRRVQSDGRFDCTNLATAEETLQSGLGSRTVAFHALAQAAGIRNQVVLAKKLGAGDAPRRYSHPLIELAAASGPLFLDVEAAENSFAVIPAAIDRGEALRMPLRTREGVEEGTARRAELVRLTAIDPARERSQADGTLRLGPDGDLQAELTIRLGASRGAQVRARLRTAGPGARQQYLAELAARILPGAVDVSGAVENSEDRDHPVVLRLRCRIPEFAPPARATVELGRLLPALALGRMYASSPSRTWPMLIDEVLIESAHFVLHLPPGIKAEPLPPAVRAHSRFGEFRLEMRRKGGREIEIVREFAIPAQVVAPRDYAAFRAFAGRIDQLEREQIALNR